MAESCQCWMTDQSTWTTYGDAVEPGSQWEYNPDCPVHSQHVWDPVQRMYIFRDPALNAQWERDSRTDCPNPRCDDGTVFDSHDIYDPGKPCPTCEGRGTIPKRQPALSP